VLKNRGGITKYKFELGEWSGAFGDLGTLIPFVVGYIAVLGINPTGILVSFGISMIIAGLHFKTPFPVQPMKAIGATAIASAGAITPNMVWGAGLFSGLFWLIVSMTGVLKWVAKIASKPLIRGISLGLGVSFMMQGTDFMSENVIIASIAVVIAILLMNSKRMPAMLVLLALGIIISLITNPLPTIQVSFTLPTFALGELTWQDTLTGVFILAIPQIPLTLGNAVIASTAENNRLFPEHPTTEKRVATFKGIMNLATPIIGGIPMCHGAGGIAAHTRFGGKTGGTMIIIGGTLLILGLFFAQSVLSIFGMIPLPVLGTILFFAGLELAMSARDIGADKQGFYILLITAGFSLWNVGIGFLAGLLVQQLTKWRKIT